MAGGAPVAPPEGSGEEGEAAAISVASKLECIIYFVRASLSLFFFFFFHYSPFVCACSLF